mgnify:CR=1 FL=1
MRQRVTVPFEVTHSRGIGRRVKGGHCLPGQMAKDAIRRRLFDTCASREIRIERLRGEDAPLTPDGPAQFFRVRIYEAGVEVGFVECTIGHEWVPKSAHVANPGQAVGIISSWSKR